MKRLSDGVYPPLLGILQGLILLGFGLLAALPAFMTGNVISDDTLNHLILSRHFVDQLVDGELYPRWLAGLNDGLGSPAMFFYGPVPYYITALFRPLAGSDPEGWHQLGLAAGLAIVASGFTAFAWLRLLGNNKAALIGALLYMGAPYHLIVDFYQRFAFAELWSMVWMPLILLFVHALVKEHRRALFRLAACYALLIMTHLPMTLLFSIVPPLYALFLSNADARIQVGMRVACAMLLGIGLSAVYLLPALQMQDFAQFNLMKSGRLYYGNNFLFYDNHIYPDLFEVLKFQSVIIGGSFLVIVGSYGLGKYLLEPSRDRIAGFWLLVGVVSFFMVLPISRPMWEMFPILQTVQFPVRFGGVITLSMAALLTLWMGAGQLCARENIPQLIIICLIGIMEAIPVVKVYPSFKYLMKQPSLDLLNNQIPPDGPFKVVVETAKISGYTFFLPIWAATSLVKTQFGDRKGLVTLRSLASVPEVAVISAATGVSVLKIKHVNPRHITMTLQSSSPGMLRVKQFYFPGWMATIRGDGAELKVRPTRSSGLIEMDIPAGNHVIDLVLTAGWAERVGLLVSLVSLIIFIATWVKLRHT